MSKTSLFVRVSVLMICVFSIFVGKPVAASNEAANTPTASLPINDNVPALQPTLFDIGTPSVRDIWVDPNNGDDGNDGATPATAFQTLTAAWNSIPMNTALAQGVRINLQPGTYPESSMPVYWESRRGTYSTPIWIRGTGSLRSQVVLQGGMNIYDTDYIYFENLTASFNGDIFHCELCDHVLIRNVVFNGGGAAQETIKVNQSQYLYIENSELRGAYENVIDYVAVQYGHIVNNRIHGGGDWCAYVKGGSAYILVEANIIYDCGTGGFSAGQGTGFQYMVAPWIQYEAYDIKVINNVIRDTEGAGLGVNGGYNVLLAYNTMYRVGSRSHVIEVVFGLRSCDGQPGDSGREHCQQYLDQGGWGTTVVDNGSNAINIPDRNVYIYNNIVYNPAGYQSAWQHFAVYDARTNSASSNVPLASTDENLSIRGNVIWNGSASMPLGVEDNSDACIASDSNCNATQLRTDNAINTIEPEFVNVTGGDFHPIGTWLSNVTWYSIPDYVWELSVPAGTNSNAVQTDIEGNSRSESNAPGAYRSSSSTGTSSQTAKFYSSGLQDGWILESTETSGTGGIMNSTTTTFILGDDASDRQYRAILHFDTSSLPDTAVITSASLRLRNQSTSGTNPFSILGALRVDARKPDFGAPALELADFLSSAAKNNIASFNSSPVNSWYSAAFNSIGRAYINKTGTTQFKIYFTTDDNNDNGIDIIKFYSGNAGTSSRPRLVIQYYVP